MNTSMIKVIIADDHPIVTTGIQALLQNAADQTLVGKAHSLAELSNLLEHTTADVLLFDLNIPGDDYEESLHYLTTHHSELQIIAFTSYNDVDLVKLVMKKGAVGYILKDTHPQELCAAIQTVYAGKTYIGQAVHLSQGHASSDSARNQLRDGFQKRMDLSKREQEILALICQGLTSQNIAKELFISKHTVETHRKNMLRKLNVNSSMELVHFAVKQGIV
ncbi:MAG: LuxR C-terminal-related transcriptional regulator [Saprospiraceae bacterium]